MEIATILAVLSILISGGSAWYSYSQNERLNKINIRSKYFEKIFDEHLIKNLPKARKYIRFDENGCLRDTGELSEALTNMKHDALYFMYADKEFYDNLRNLIMDLDDYVNECGNRPYDNDQHPSVLKNIQEKMEAIYECILKNSLNGDNGFNR